MACDFTVYPSVEEGSAAIVEIFGYGKPCICADFGAMLKLRPAAAA